MAVGRPADTDELSGMAASPGTVEGVARVVADAAELELLEEGEILVARITAPSWGPVFGRIQAVVTDIGGMMSHAAIVCREYGLPAVTGTGSATTSIPTGTAHPGRRLLRHRHDPRLTWQTPTSTPSSSAAVITRTIIASVPRARRPHASACSSVRRTSAAGRTRARAPRRGT